MLYEVKENWWLNGGYEERRGKVNERATVVIVPTSALFLRVVTSRDLSSRDDPSSLITIEAGNTIQNLLFCLLLYSYSVTLCRNPDNVSSRLSSLPPSLPPPPSSPLYPPWNMEAYLVIRFYIPFYWIHWTCTVWGFWKWNVRCAESMVKCLLFVDSLGQWAVKQM